MVILSIRPYIRVSRFVGVSRLTDSPVSKRLLLVAGTSCGLHDFLDSPCETRLVWYISPKPGAHSDDLVPCIRAS